MSKLTRIEAEYQIKNIDLMLANYDSLIKFIWEYSDDNINIYDSKTLFMRELYYIDIEDILRKIKSNLEEI